MAMIPMDLTKFQTFFFGKDSTKPGLQKLTRTLTRLQRVNKANNLSVFALDEKPEFLEVLFSANADKLISFS